MRQQPLNVPVLRQSRTLPYCGHTCARMVLAHHGYGTSRSIARSIIRFSNGRPIESEEIGSVLLSYGLNVEIYNWHHGLPNRFAELRRQHVINTEMLSWCRREVVSGWDKERRRATANFIEHGGIFIPSPISIARLKAAVRNNCPPILQVNVSTLYFCRAKQRQHYLVVRHISDCAVQVNDPNPYGDARCSYPTSHMIFAMHSMHGAAIIASPKQR